MDGYRPKSSADHGITFHYAFELECRDDDRVFVRSKRSMGAKTPWSDWTQMYPSLLDLSAHTPHHPDTIPPLADNKNWEDFETKVAPTLIRLLFTHAHTLHTHTHTHTHSH